MGSAETLKRLKRLKRLKGILEKILSTETVDKIWKNELIVDLVKALEPGQNLTRL